MFDQKFQAMDDEQLRAYGQLAQAIALHAFVHAQHGDSRIKSGIPELREIPGPIFDHMHMSTFERVAVNLCKLQILADVGSAQKRPCFFQFDCTIDDAGTVAMRNWKSGPPFDELLATFVDVFGDFGSTWGFSTESSEPLR